LPTIDRSGFFLIAAPHTAMPDNDPASSPHRPLSSNLSAEEETRAAIDVMFEALAHIQASMEESSEEARKRAYTNFKKALYRRFEQTLEDRSRSGSLETRGDGAPGASAPPAERGANETTPAGSSSADEPGPTLETTDSDSDEDTLEKFWPSISVD
jgi:hypothetical protein